MSEPPSGSTSSPPAPPPVPFLRQHGLALGLTKHRLDGPAFHRVFGSVRVPAGVELDVRTLAQAALLVVPGAVVSHHTAAVLWGGVVPGTPLTHVTVKQGTARRAREGLRCHVRPAPASTRHRGLPLTSPSRTFLDLAPHLGLVDLVVLGDSLVHRGVTTVEELRQAAHGARSRSAAHARAAAELVRAGAESPMETRVRLMLHLAGLPEPRLQHALAEGRLRLDLAWPELRVAVEYDGRQHAEDPHQWGRDLGRREWLDGRGWRLVVLRAGDVYDDPWSTILRIAAVLAARGYEKPLPGPPARFSEHFPGRVWRRARG